jgi:Spy/CpxP family protein refolding chaperone
MTRMTRVAALVLVVPCVLPISVLAQGRGPDPQLNRQEMVRRIQERFRNRLAEQLELDRAQREALGEVFTEFGGARAELLSERRAVSGEVRELLTGDRSEDGALALLERLRELRRQEEDLLVQEEERLLEVLEPSQVLQLQSLRDQFGNQIRRLGPPAGTNGPGPRGFGPGGPPRSPRR